MNLKNTKAITNRTQIMACIFEYDRLGEYLNNNENGMIEMEDRAGNVNVSCMGINNIIMH